MPSSARLPLRFLAICAIASACDAAPPTTTSPAGPVAAAAPAVRGRGVEARFAAAAREVPGFGGWFYDADGVLTGYVTDARHGPAARALLAREAAREARSGHAPRAADVRVRVGRYSFAQLAAWRDRLSAALLARGDVVLVDADEGLNRVRVGVRDAASLAAVRAAAEGLGVPAAALVVAAEPAAEPRLALYDHAGPYVPGGYQLSGYASPTYVILCSLGFNVLTGFEGNGFVTASHCSGQQGAVDPLMLYQPARWHDVGNETADPPLVTGGACPAGRYCRFSDASLYGYTPGHMLSITEIARTASWGTTSPGSRTVTSSFTIVAEKPWPTTGEYLDKMGAMTGWTYGRVSATCVDLNVTTSLVTLWCQDAVDALADYGDSGGPVFLWRGGNEVELAGIVVAGSPSRFYLSAMWNIEHELGALRTF